MGLFICLCLLSVVAGCALCSWPASGVTWRRWSGPRGTLTFPSWTTGGRRVGLVLPAGRVHEVPERSLPRLREDYCSVSRRRAEEMFQGLCERSRGSESSALLSVRRLEGITRNQGGSRGRRPAFSAGPRSMNPLGVL